MKIRIKKDSYVNQANLKRMFDFLAKDFNEYQEIKVSYQEGFIEIESGPPSDAFTFQNENRDKSCTPVTQWVDTPANEVFMNSPEVNGVFPEEMG